MPVLAYPPSARGFTIVELVVVLLVLSIASAMVLPVFSGSETMQLRSAAQLLAADLDAAKVESMTHADDPRAVLFDTDDHVYHIAPASDINSPIANPYDKNPYRVEFGRDRASALPDIQIQSVDLDGDDQLGFGLYGQLDQTTPATITLAGGNATLDLTLDPATGEVTIGQIQ